MSLAKHVDIIEPNLNIIGFECRGALQQEFRIIKYPQPQADLSQQPHRFDMLGIAAQKVSANFFCPQWSAFMEMMRHRNQFFRQGQETPFLIARSCRFAHSTSRFE